MIRIIIGPDAIKKEGLDRSLNLLSNASTNIRMSLIVKSYF